MTTHTPTEADERRALLAQCALDAAAGLAVTSLPDEYLERLHIFDLEPLAARALEARNRVIADAGPLHPAAYRLNAMALRLNAALTERMHESEAPRR